MDFIGQIPPRLNTSFVEWLQMLDLDGRNSGQTDHASFTDMIWSDDDLFGDEWMDFSEQTEEDDFWNDVFEEELLVLR